MRRTIYDGGHEAFRDTGRTFLAEEVVAHAAGWDRGGIVPRELFAAAGAQGLLGMAVPQEFGGGGAPDFRFNAVLGEEVTAEDAPNAEWWCTELQGRALDTCLQPFGGYGDMTEYPTARASADARVTRICGGTTEILKEVVGRGLGS